MVWCNYNCSAPESKLGKMWRCPECNKRMLVYNRDIDMGLDTGPTLISKHKKKVKDINYD